MEETLNELLEKEAESLTQAARYERSEARQGYRSGHYDRNLTMTSGDVTLHMPRFKGVSFETAIIERYRRRESSVEEALIEMYLAGVSVRRNWGGEYENVAVLVAIAVNEDGFRADRYTHRGSVYSPHQWRDTPALSPRFSMSAPAPV